MFGYIRALPLALSFLLFSSALKPACGSETPAMPPLCTVRAEVAAIHDDGTVDLRVLDTHGVFSVVSCDEEAPRAGEVWAAETVWKEDLAVLEPGCEVSGALTVANGATEWR